MDGNVFDHMTKVLAGIGPRRQAVIALAGTGLAAVATRFNGDDVDAKRRCRKRLKDCGGKKKCCNKSGFIKCGEVVHTTKPQCEEFSGRHCCGLDGASCDPLLNGCDCCGELFCENYETGALCRSEAT